MIKGIIRFKKVSKNEVRRFIALKLGVMGLFLVLCVLSLPNPSSATYAVITIDVCWTCGDDFQANWNGKDYGVPLIAEKLEAHGFKGTFFVSPYCPTNLENKMYENLKFLVSRGHDLQLHTHPAPIDPSRPYLNQYSREEKKEILTKGINIIMEAGAPAPIAHRAGSLSIDRETLELLPELGIKMDSSIYSRWSNCKVSLPENLRNRFVKIDGPFQLPIFLIGTIPYIGQRGTTALQLGSTTWWQQKNALEQVADQKLPLVTLFLHFFDLYKYERNKEPFEPLIPFAPNCANIEALDNILNMLAADPRFKVVTARELWEIHTGNPNALDGPSFVPYTGLMSVYAKCWQHFFSESTLGKTVALAPFVLVGICLVFVYWIARKNSPIRKRKRRILK